MRRPPIRLTRDEEAVCRRWGLGVLGVVTTMVVLTLTMPAFRNAPADRLASECTDRAGEAVARLIETRRETERRLAIDAASAGCDSQVASRRGAAARQLLNIRRDTD